MEVFGDGPEAFSSFAILWNANIVYIFLDFSRYAHFLYFQIWDLVENNKITVLLSYDVISFHSYGTVRKNGLNVKVADVKCSTWLGYSQKPWQKSNKLLRDTEVRIFLVIWFDSTWN